MVFDSNLYHHLLDFFKTSLLRISQLEPLEITLCCEQLRCRSHKIGLVDSDNTQLPEPHSPSLNLPAVIQPFY